jgi:hypothetical protein
MTFGEKTEETVGEVKGVLDMIDWAKDWFDNDVRLLFRTVCWTVGKIGAWDPNARLCNDADGDWGKDSDTGESSGWI